jgi:hypothetical protein
MNMARGGFKKVFPFRGYKGGKSIGPKSYLLVKVIT